MEDILKKTDAIKAFIDKHRPLPQDVTGQLRAYYRIGLTYSSNALEGNTLTESETKVIIEEGITVGGKTLIEHIEAVDHALAFDRIYTLLNKEITESDILDLHRLLYCRLDTESAGKYREKNVLITGTDYIPPDYSKVPDLMSAHISDLSPKVVQNIHPLIRISDIHGEFESIHPFIDGNGRIGRLLLSVMAIKFGYCPVIIPPVRRAEYIASMRGVNKGSKEALRQLIIGVVYEEMKSLKKILERLLPVTIR